MFKVRANHIQDARELPNSFEVLRAEQRYVGGWLRMRFKRYDEEFASAGNNVPMVEVENETGIAYGAVKYAYGADLPTVKQITIRDYFKALCPDSEVDPRSGMPLSPVDPAKIGAIVDNFGQQQEHLVDSLTRRFDGVALGSGVICIAMMCEMVEAELTLPNDPKNGGQ